MQKGIDTIYTLVVFALIILLGIAEYAMASTPQIRDETSDWKTYRNEQYGFEFKYPALGTATYDSTDTQQSVRVVIPHDQSFVFDRAVGHLWYVGVAKGSNSIEKSSIQIAHLPTYKTVNPGGYMDADGTSGAYSAYWIQKDDVYYGFFYKSLDLNNLQKQILSTFKFISSENKPQMPQEKPMESIEYTTPWGIYPPLFRILQWLTTLLLIFTFIFKFRPDMFKIIFSVILTVISLLFTGSCFIVDASLPKFCEYKILGILALPFFILDPLGDIIPIGTLRNSIMPIVVPLIAFGVWYLIGGFISMVYKKVFKL
jgi:hypothetical protein